MALGVVCARCGEGRLQWVELSDMGEGQYFCEFWKKHEPGEQCAVPVTEEEYRELAEEAREARSTQPALLNKGATATLAGPSKAANVAALQSGQLVVKRQSLLPKVLSVSDEAAVVKKPFKSPLPGTSSSGSQELLRRLSASRRFVPWGSKEPFKPLQGNECDEPEVAKVDEKAESTELPPGVEPLVLWQPEDDPKHASPASRPIIVDPHLTKFLRPHQREGVQFVFECVAGLRDFSNNNENGRINLGCILADDMGLGKTLQSITLLWTVLQQGFNGAPMAKRAIVVTPTSLVSNWEAEIKKWLENRVKVLALCETSRADVMAGITNFVSPRGQYRVLIISYETFRLHASRLQQPGCCDLLICDEAHRLKNDKTLTNQALAALSCRRRVLLSGTPMQNDLEEFYSMVNFTNPGILGDATAFRRYFENPILAGREPDATDEERTLCSERSNELSEKVNQFILRRTNALLSNHLPPKVVEVVCCNLTELQLKIYRHFIESKKVKTVLEDVARRSQVLASITALKKLCNHPKLIFDTLKAGSAEAGGFEGCMDLFPSAVLSSRNGSWTGGDGFWVQLSGKMSVLARLLALLRKTTDDRIVLVSNYTQTLDLFAQLCRERSYPHIRLDGSTGISKRQKLVQRFNDPTQDEFVFLLSSKAGGCGLNLIGGNRLILFDPDWNPANDKQAAARIWRDGQKKRVYIYRFLSTGTIEEKVYQRQMSKEGLQKVVDSEKAPEGKAQVNLLSSEDLRDLFTLRDETGSDTHDSLSCKRCPSADAAMPKPEGSMEQLLHAAATVEKVELPTAGDGDVGELPQDIGKFQEMAGVLKKLHHWQRQVGTPLEEDLQNWGHHRDSSTVPDSIMQQAGAGEVSFIFSCQIDGKLTPQEPNAPSGLQRLTSRSPLHSNYRGNTISINKPLVRMVGPFLANRPSQPTGIRAPGLQSTQFTNLGTQVRGLPTGCIEAAPPPTVRELSTGERQNIEAAARIETMADSAVLGEDENEKGGTQTGKGKRKRGRPKKTAVSSTPKATPLAARRALSSQLLPASTSPLSSVTYCTDVATEKEGITTPKNSGPRPSSGGLATEHSTTAPLQLESPCKRQVSSSNDGSSTAASSAASGMMAEGEMPMVVPIANVSTLHSNAPDHVHAVGEPPTRQRLQPERTAPPRKSKKSTKSGDSESESAGEEFSAESEDSYRAGSGSEDDEEFF